MDQERERELRAWLKKPEARTLQTVLEAKSRLLQEKALQEAFHATDGNSYSLKSSASMRTAERYEMVMQILSEITAQTAPFQVVKLKP